MAGHASLRARLLGERDWSEALRREAIALRALPDPAAAGDAALELAGLLTEVEPDRRAAIESYVLAWKRGRQVAALSAARALCLELGDLASAAKLARLELQHRPDPRLLLDEGLARLDAGEAAAALPPLTEAARRRPDDPEIAAALAVARRGWPSGRAEVERLVDQARAAGATPAAVTAYLQAARVVKVEGGDPLLYGRLLKAAFDSAPRHDRAYRLLEAVLIGRGDGDELLSLYRLRIEDAPSLAARFEDLRRAGSLLVLRDVQPGLGLRLLDRALREAYAHRLPSPPGQLAALELLRRHAVATSLLPRFLGLVSEALEAPQDELSTVWLAAAGLEIAWQRLGDREVARGYAGRLAALAPHHPALRQYLDEGGMADVPASGADDDQLVYLDFSAWSAAAAASPPPAAVPVGGLAQAFADDGGEMLTLADEPPVDDAIDVDFDAPSTSAPSPLSAVPASVPVPAPTPVPVPDPEPAAPLAAAPADEPSAPQPLGRVALVPRPAHLARPGALIPRGALDALQRAARDRPGVPAPAPVPADARDRAPRLEIPIDCVLTPIEGRRFAPTAVVTRDLSASGLFVATGIAVDIGDTLGVELRLPTATPLEERRFSARARVVRRAGSSGYGLVFIDPPAALVSAIDALVAARS
jgi:tetratricopeptide (TPR) repeat protein